MRSEVSNIIIIESSKNEGIMYDPITQRVFGPLFTSVEATNRFIDAQKTDPRVMTPSAFLRAYVAFQHAELKRETAPAKESEAEAEEETKPRAKAVDVKRALEGVK